MGNKAETMSRSVARAKTQSTSIGSFRYSVAVLKEDEQKLYNKIIQIFKYWLIIPPKKFAIKRVLGYSHVYLEVEFDDSNKKQIAGILNEVQKKTNIPAGLFTNQIVPFLVKEREAPDVVYYYREDETYEEDFGN